MVVDSILPVVSAPATEGIEPTRRADFGDDFANRLDNAMRGVSSQVNEADVRLARVASGEDADLHGMMIALQEADIAVRMMVSVRDEAVEAYEKVLNMQI
jgi:flagellar hook-basal body complex protein FliE